MCLLKFYLLRDLTYTFFVMNIYLLQELRLFLLFLNRLVFCLRGSVVSKHRSQVTIFLKTARADVDLWIQIYFKVA